MASRSDFELEIRWRAENNACALRFIQGVRWTLPNFVVIYRAGNSVQANLMAAALEDEGIKAIVPDEIPVYLPASPQIMVAKADAARSRELVKRLEQGKSVD